MLSRQLSGSPSLSCHWTERFHSGRAQACQCHSSSQSKKSRGNKESKVVIKEKQNIQSIRLKSTFHQKKKSKVLKLDSRKEITQIKRHIKETDFM